MFRCAETKQFYVFIIVIKKACLSSAVTDSSMLLSRIVKYVDGIQVAHDMIQEQFSRAWTFRDRRVLSGLSDIAPSFKDRGS